MTEEYSSIADSARFIVLGEASMLATAILRSHQKFGGTSKNAGMPATSKLAAIAMAAGDNEEDEEDQDVNFDPTLKSLIRLKKKLRKNPLDLSDPSYLRPFCEVIKNKDISGPITGLALQSLLKFINYGYLANNDYATELIGDSVTKARFIGTDTSSDEVVLLKILSVLRELIVRGYKSLSNEAICEIMQSCFRIVFEPRLSELLRRSAEQALSDMCLVLFKKLDQYPDIMRPYSSSKFSGRGLQSRKAIGKFSSSVTSPSDGPQTGYDFRSEQNSGAETGQNVTQTSSPSPSQGVTHKEHPSKHKSQNFDLVCIYELFCYLTTLINPLPEAQNTESMISVGLNLLIIAFETACLNIGSKTCLLSIVKNTLCWNIMCLLQTDRSITTLAAALRLAFLVFINMRQHLKYQMESFIIRLMDLISTQNAPLDAREMCLEYLASFFRHLQYFPHELYYNFDCDPYASNLLEELLNLFSKNCFVSNPSQQQQISASSPHQSVPISYSPLQMLSLDAVLASLRDLQKAQLADSVYLTFSGPIPSQAPSQSEKEAQHETGESISPRPEATSPPEFDIGVGGAPPADEPQPQPQPQPQTPAAQGVGGDQTIEKDAASQSLPLGGIKSHDMPSFKIPASVEELRALKERKRLLWNATELFNQKPAKGIQSLQENGLIHSNADIVAFLRDNQKLDKRQIGDYLANKKNLAILEAFASSFNFKGLRIDEALRQYLESFRLPGEAPLISLIVEQFAHHWHESNGQPFVNEDAAFTLAYAVIMLNVDQHNVNVKRQTTPMTVDDFISNLRQVNGEKDFDPEMLKQIYHAIKTNEIIMPAEQQGVIREKYLWKCLLRKAETPSGIYLYAIQLIHPENSSDEEVSTKTPKPEADAPLIPLSMINGPIFDILWGPTVAAMTYIFDKINPSVNSGLARRILNNGFTSCALLCATYGHLDNLIVSLCKFSAASPLIVGSGYKEKSQMAAICLFGICHDYANEIRESWSNVIELLLCAYKEKLLDDVVEIEDFALNSTIKLKKRQIERNQSKNQSENQGFLSYFSSYFAGGSTTGPQQQSDPNDSGVEELSTSTAADSSSPKDSKTKAPQGDNGGQKMNCFAKALITMIDDSKFFHVDSLVELVKALINAKLENENESEEHDEELEDLHIMKLELLMQVTLHNRDRVSVFWPQVSAYLLRLFTHCRGHNEWFAERVISAVFRLAIRFAPRPDSLNEQSFQLLSHMTVSLNASVIQKRYTAIALHSFVACCHPYITKLEDWNLIFNLLLLVGIGHQRRVNLVRSGSIQSDIYQRESEEGMPSGKLSGSQQNLHQSAHDSSLRGYTSDSECDPATSQLTAPPTNPYQLMASDMKTKKYKIADLVAYEKCTETLSLIVRDILQKNENNMQEEMVDGRKVSFSELVVNSLKKYVEVSVKIESIPAKTDLRRSHSGQRIGARSKSPSSRSRSMVSSVLLSSDSEDEAEQSASAKGTPRPKAQPKLSAVTESCALKLLDLMHHVHVNATSVSHNEVPSEVIWKTVWCPLLQGFALLCCDSRRPVRTTALTYLQKALLLHDLKVLNAQQWESCFNKVLFPLLAKLLEPLNVLDPFGMDETRMRATSLLCKVFLQHLNPLFTLPTFTALWLTILDFMDKYIKADMQTDLVREAIPESLKNMLLVMDTAGCFNDALAGITWDRINLFLPNLKDEIAPPPVPNQPKLRPETPPNQNFTLPTQQHSQSYQHQPSDHHSGLGHQPSTIPTPVPPGQTEASPDPTSTSPHHIPHTSQMEGAPHIQSIPSHLSSPDSIASSFVAIELPNATPVRSSSNDVHAPIDQGTSDHNNRAEAASNSPNPDRQNIHHERPSDLPQHQAAHMHRPFQPVFHSQSPFSSPTRALSPLHQAAQSGSVYFPQPAQNQYPWAPIPRPIPPSNEPVTSGLATEPPPPTANWTPSKNYYSPV